MIVLLCHDPLFGMELSNNEKKFILNFFSQGIDFIKKEYFPLLPYKEKLNLRATCMVLFTTLPNDQQFYDIYNQYNDGKKQIAPSCAFLDCIKKKKYKEVEWFLKNEIHNPLFNIHYPNNCIEYFALNPLVLIEANDLKMKELFAAYRYDEKKFVESLKKIQEKYCVPVALNEKLTNWERTSHYKNGFIKGFDPISNTCTIKSVREFRITSLFPLLRTNCHFKSILAACIGDINCFKEEIKDMVALGDFIFIHCTTLLSIFAAFKNKDLDLIRFILTQPSLYTEHIKSDTAELLSYFLLNTPVENSKDLTISKDICFEDRHIQWIKQLIQEGIFTAVPKMIKNNKDNKQIKEVYKTLVSSIYEIDPETEDQRKKAQIKNKVCLIQ